MGKLNILHHKSYHVYNRDNVERVRRDEAAAELEAAAGSQRALAADSEARIALLRDRAKKQRGGNARTSEGEKALEKQLKGSGWKGKGRAADDAGEDPARATIIRSGEVAGDGDTDRRQAGLSGLAQTTSIMSNGHINFWADQESGRVAAQPLGQNASYLRDKKKEEDKWDDQITMYLGRPAKELQPWYSDKELKSGEERKRSEGKQLEKAYKDEELKRLDDPLALMNGFLKQRDASRKSHRSAFNGSTEVFEPKLLSSRRRRREASRSPSPEGSKRRRRNAPSPPRHVGVRDGEATFAPPPNLVPAHASTNNNTETAVAAMPRIMKVDTSSERARALALVDAERRKKRAASSVASTPVSVRGSEYGDAYNREATRDAASARKRWARGQRG